jgi:hypothetical protein
LFPFYKELRIGQNCTRSTKSYGKDKIVPVLQIVMEKTKILSFP